MANRSSRRRVIALGATVVGTGVCGCLEVGTVEGTPGEDTPNTETTPPDGTENEDSDEDGVGDPTETDAPGGTKEEYPGWLRRQYDLANTGHKTNTTVPRSGVSVAWTHDISDVAGDTIGGLLLLAFDGILYVQGLGYLRALDARTGEVVWTVTIPTESGRANPTLTPDGETIYVPVGEVLYAIDATTGEQRWTFEVSQGADTPVATEDMVYFKNSPEGFLFAVDADGNRQWWVRLGGIQRPSTPAIVEDRLYVTGEISLFVLNRVTGEMVWNTGVSSPPLSSPAVRHGHVYVGGNLRFSAFDLQGERQWQVDTTQYVTEGPVVDDESVYAIVNAVDTLIAADAMSGAIEWERSPVLVSPVVVGETVFHATNQLTALDAATGDVRWTFDDASMTPIVVDGMIYTASDAGTIYALTDG